jgi:hypothetical protein
MILGLPVFLFGAIAFVFMIVDHLGADQPVKSVAICTFFVLVGGGMIVRGYNLTFRSFALVLSTNGGVRNVTKSGDRTYLLMVKGHVENTLTLRI